MNNDIFPKPPEFDSNDWAKCKENGDFRPIVFEWYKFVGQLCSVIARFDPSSPIVKQTNSVNYSILIGLLNRCSRLMLSNIVLSNEGKFGETTAIIDRCIFESCVKIQWMIKKEGEGSFKKYLANSLKTEIRLKKKINKISESRGGNLLKIENRMINSANRHIKLSRLSEAEVDLYQNKFPDLRSMINSLKLPDFFYMAGQRIGSHHVHGNWSSLLFHYLKEDEEHGLIPKDHDCESKIDQYLVISILVLESLKSFIIHVIYESYTEGFFQIFNGVEEELFEIYQEVVGDDFSE